MTSQEPISYTFRPGALDAIQRTRNLRTESQLAAALGVTLDDLALLRAGTPVTPRFAIKVASMQGDDQYLTAWFDLYHPTAA